MVLLKQASFVCAASLIHYIVERGKAVCTHAAEKKRGLLKQEHYIEKK